MSGNARGMAQHMRTLSRIAVAVAATLALSSMAAPLPIDPKSIVTPRPASGTSAKTIDRAIAALDAGDLAGAEAAFREAIRLDPKAPGGYIGLAEVAARRNQAAQVESWLKKALEVAPDSVETLRVWGRYQSQQGRFADAEATLKKAVAAAPDNLDVRLELGEVQLLGLKNPRAAEQTFRGALERNPTHVGARIALAKALAAQGRADEAVAAFEQAAKAAPRDPEPLLALARYQASRAQVDASLATLDRLIAAVPSAAQAYLDRGDLLLLKNDVPRAMDSYRALVKAVPEQAAIGHYRLAALYEAQQQWAQAEQSYRAAIKADPKFVAAYNNLAFMLANRGQKLDEAQRLAERAVELAPQVPTTLDTLGWVHRAQGNLEAAAKALDRAIAAQPRNPVFHYHLGIVRSDQGRKAEARKSLERALEIDPKFRGADDARQRLEKLKAAR